jgi:ketosteroid isomerase-like protein
MTRSAAHEDAVQPEDLSRFFLERANAGDVEGLVALYQPDAVLAFPPGQITVGRTAIREVYQTLLATRPTFTSAGQRAALRNGLSLLAMTRVRRPVRRRCGR